MAEKTINLRGLKCPLPALRARKALTGLKTGDVLIAECTDPHLRGIGRKRERHHDKLSGLERTACQRDVDRRRTRAD